MDPCDDVAHLRKKKYYKFTNKEECHNSFQYVDGLNVDILPFASGKHESCCAGGLYFTTRKFLPMYQQYGVNIREVTLPFEDPDFKIVADPEGNKWRANKIIFGEKFSLLDPDKKKVINTIVEFKLYKEFENLFEQCVVNGLTEIMDWLSYNDYENENIRRTIKKNAKTHRHKLSIGGLDGLSIYWLMELASMNGHVNVLDWFFNVPFIKNKIDLIGCYPNTKLITMIGKAACNGRVGILQWFHDYPHPEFRDRMKECFKNPIILRDAASNGHVNVLIWLSNHPEYEFIFGNSLIEEVSLNGHVDVLKWFVDNNKYYEKATCKMVTSAIAGGHLPVLEFWHSWNKINGFDVHYEKNVFKDIELTKNHIDIMEWMLDNKYYLDYSSVIDKATEKGFVDIIDWMHQHKNELDCGFKYSTQTILVTLYKKHQNILDWFLDHPEYTFNHREIFDRIYCMYARKMYLEWKQKIDEKTPTRTKIMNYFSRFSHIQTAVLSVLFGVSLYWINAIAVVNASKSNENQ